MELVSGSKNHLQSSEETTLNGTGCQTKKENTNALK